MQTPLPEQTHTASFFSRERRRQRMLQFLAAFERRSWSRAPEVPFILPMSKEDVRDQALSKQPAANR